MRALRLLKQLADEIRGTLAETLTLEQLGVAENRGQGVIQFVSDTGD